MKILKRVALWTAMALMWSAPAFAAEEAAVVDSGNTAWLLISSALVMLMTPGLAFFYAGMVGRKNVVSTLLQNFAALGFVGILWVVIGYSLAFGSGNAYIGGLEFFMLDGMTNGIDTANHIPTYAFMIFQCMFAVIAPALITGAIAERVHFKAWLLFMCLWSLVVYAPVAHWVWHPEGWLYKMGGLDFAGGLVVHMSAGFSSAVAALMFGKRIGTPHLNRPNDIPMILLGAALLWFGWFGFNAGSALTSDVLAAHSFVMTFVGGAAAMVGWIMTDWVLHKKPTAVGAAIGLVVGLVVITPAAGFVSVASSLALCFISAVICNLASRWVKEKTHLDDALDVVACHGLGGMLGAIGTGLLASGTVNGNVEVEGLLVGGEAKTFLANMTGVVAVGVFAPAATFFLLKIVNVITPIRVSEQEESEGLDASLHGEVSRYNACQGVAM